jgi:hypothetical protein
MSKTLIVNNIPFQYPTAGDEPGWGNSASAWAEAVTNVLSDLLGPNDILETAFNIANNQSDNSGTNGDVTGLIFNAASVRAANISYSIYRISDSNISGKAETGTIQIVYDNAVGWIINQGNILGSSGVTFTIMSTGQIKYKSTDIGSTNYNGTLKFRAKTLQQ